MNPKHFLIIPLALLLVSCGGGSSNPLLTDNTNGSVSIDNLDQDNQNSPDIEVAKEERKALEAKLKEARTLIADTKKLDISTEQATVKDNLAKARSITAELTEIDDFFLEADELSNAIGEIEDTMNSFISVGGDAPVVFDLGGSTPDSVNSILSFARAGGTIYAVGTNGLYNTTDSSKTLIPMPAGVGSQSAFYSQKFQTLYINGTDGGFYALKGGEIIPSNLKEGSIKHTGHLIAYGANLYLNDPVQRAFWKYSSTADGFQLDGSALDQASLENTTIQSAAIDGNVFILTSAGDLMKYTAGQKVDLTVERSTKGLSSQAMLYTDLGSSYLYIFDPVQKKIIKFLKKKDELTLSKEYTLETGFTSGFVLPGDGKAYLTDGKKVFSVEL